MPFARNVLGGLLAAGLALAVTAAGAEPVTLDHLLQFEELGPNGLSPDGRHLVITTEAPYDSAARFDTARPEATLGRLLVADLGAGGIPRPLLTPERSTGYVAGPFSPSGRFMIVHRLHDAAWESGVVEVANGAVRWLGRGIDLPVFGRTVHWTSDTAFIAITLRQGDRPLHVKLGSENQARLTALWAQQADGKEPTLKVISSGAARSEAPRQDRALIRFDLATGTQETLALGGFFDLEPSPSGRYLALLDEAEPVGLVDAPAIRMHAPTRRRALKLLDLATGAWKAPCGRCTTLIQPLAWRSEKDQLLVFRHDVDKPETTGELVSIDASSGRVTAHGQDMIPAIDYGEEGLATVHADWLGETPIVYARLPNADRNDWLALAPDGPRNLTRHLPTVSSDIVVTGDRQLLSRSNGEIWRTNISGQSVRTGEMADAWVRTNALGVGYRPATAPIHADRPWMQSADRIFDARGHALALSTNAYPLAVAGDKVIVEERPLDGARRVSVLTRGRSRRDILILNAALAALDQGQVKTFETRSASGAVLKHWILLPHDWRPGRALPGVVVPYPGTSGGYPPSRFGYGLRGMAPNGPLLAAQGYAVLAPAMPRDPTTGEPAEGLADQILTAVDEAVRLGYVDPDRLALWGHSFGGFAALATATQTGRFKAIIAQAGMSDFAANWASTEPFFTTSPEDGAPTPAWLGYHETGQAAMFGPLWSQSARYIRNSPLFQADKVTTPLMLIYGDQDFVALAQGQAMFNALYRQDKDATLVSMFGEAHHPMSPANVHGLYSLILPWLAERLSRPQGTAPAYPSLRSQ